MGFFSKITSRAKSLVKKGSNLVSSGAKFVNRIADNKIVNAATSVLPSFTVAKMVAAVVDQGEVKKEKIKETLVKNGQLADKATVNKVAESLQVQASIARGGNYDVPPVTSNGQTSNTQNFMEKLKKFYAENKTLVIAGSLGIAVLIGVAVWYFRKNKRR